MINWQKKKLEEICEVFTDGDWIESKDQSESGIRLIQTGNIGSGFFKDRGEKARYISENTFKRLHCEEIFPGDCLVSRLPDPVGRACILPKISERMITAVDCTIIRFNTSTIIPTFFNYFSQSNQYLNEVNKESTGTTRNRISRKKLGEIIIPIPSIQEQKRIIKILDEVFEKIAKTKENTEKNLQNSRDLFESYLENIFANPNKKWTKEQLGNIAKITMGQSPKGETYNTKGIGMPLINGPVEFGSDQLSETFITKYTSKPTKLCKKGDLILCVRGSTTGRTNIAGYDSCLGRGVASICANEKLINQNLLNIYIAHMRKSIFNLGTGATFPNVSSDLLSSIEIAFPPISEQKSIAEKLDEFSEQTKKLEEIYKRKLADLEELKKSILSKAFAGEL